MPTRNVNLSKQFDDFVKEQVKQGRFQNASEVMRAGLRLLEQKTSEDRKKLAILRSLAADGFNEIDQGQGIKIEGDQKLAQFIRQIGRRAAASSNRRKRGA